jgi:hypothetical protein
MSGLDSLGITSPTEFLKQVGEGFLGTDTLRDFSHASKLMRPNGLALAPKQKFLFHVYFNAANPGLLKSQTDKGLVGALVKTIDLPSFKLDTEEYVQYNRKRLVHNRITYEPVNLTLHDDGEGHVLDLWTSYYNYHFADSQYDYDVGLTTTPGAVRSRTDYNARDLYSQTRLDQEKGWGKTVTSPGANGFKPAFFRDIQIYGFNRGGFVLYTLINPVITMWKHDTYDYADDAGVMQHSVTLQYETVKYFDSADIGADNENVAGFGVESRYDTEPSTLGPGSTTSAFGQGGLVDTAGAIGNDLANGNVLGAIQKAGKSAKTFGSLDNVVDVLTQDTQAAAKGGVLDAIGGAPSRLLNFPKPGDTNIGKSIPASPKKGD